MKLSIGFVALAFGQMTMDKDVSVKKSEWLC